MAFWLKRYKMIFLFFVLLLIVGIYTFFNLPQRDFPETPVNQVTISTPSPGASPVEVEQNITTLIESEVSQLDGVDSYQSTSTRGFSNIILSLEDSTNEAELVADLNQQISSLDLPDYALETNVEAVNLETPSQSYYFTASERDQLYNLQDTQQEWQDRLKSISGVASVEFNGLEEEQVVINLEPEALQENQIQFQNVLTALEEEWRPTPMGQIQTEDGYETLTIDHYESISEINNTTIPSQNGSVPLSELATIDQEPVEQPDFVSYQGETAINLTVYLESGEDIPSVSKQVDDEVQKLASDLPENISFHHYFDQSSFISNIFDDLFLSLAIAVIAVILTTTLGLTWIGSLVVAIAIPSSLILALIPLPFLDVTLNQISVIGAIIALGILVDDSIVLNDNIERRFRLGDDPLKGTLTGIKEVRNSILTSTLAIVFTFSPLIFLSGANGAFIRALPSVLIATIIASTIVALTLVPAIRYVQYKHKRKTIKANPGLLGTWLNHGARWYAHNLVKKLIRIPKRTVALGLVLTTGLFALVVWTPFEFFPAADREEVTIDVSLNNGLTKEDTYETLQQIESDLTQSNEPIKDISLFTSGSAPQLFTQGQGNTGEETGRLYVRIDTSETNAEAFKEKWEPALRSNYEDATIFIETIEQGPPSGAPLTVTIEGNNLEEMINLRDQYNERLREEGANLVVDNVGNLTDQTVYQPNRELLNDYQISIESINQQLALRTTGTPFMTINDGLEQYDVQLYLNRLQDDETLDLDEIVIPVNSNDGPPVVPASELIEAESEEVIPTIYHEDGDRTITIRAYADDTAPIKEAIQPDIDEFNQSHEELSLSTGAETDSQDSFFTEIIVIFSIVILLVYLLIAFQFNSLSMPFLILISVYLAIAGAILGLFVTQTPISFLAVTGMVSLTGIVVRNSLVLVDFIEQSIASNETMSEAVINAAEARFKPIILTTITSIVALTPVALGGDALFKPLAITIIAGIMFSTVLTLILVPVLYIIFNKRRYKTS
ncbi:efflux RND transporter permease subunit [Alkalibacillus almallahensis]|uniref:efflux RND transporter permease subunit n=1 Tax=Alkalibacillus almallahensis TaxID=1379154 RepID=UPI00141E7E1D|nr:efflux RND transporter permease subunit [Alkalibacillus almallahensis]NIK12383.1 multidrug efflux pump subunit AcrB [Alkalibacillus almallahensis]